MGADAFITLAGEERDLVDHFRAAIEGGIDVVLDYVWGLPAEAFFKAATPKSTGTAAPRIRFVNIGSVGGKSVSLSAAAVRSSGLEIVGSGLGSNSRESIIDATGALFAAIGAAKFDISVISRPLADVERAWQIKTSDRIVLTL